MTKRSAGRRILVTGVSSGIGAATVEACKGAGAAVALVARRADRLARVEEAGRGRVRAFPTDVTDGCVVRRTLNRDEHIWGSGARAGRDHHALGKLGEGMVKALGPKKEVHDEK